MHVSDLSQNRPSIDLLLFFKENDLTFLLTLIIESLMHSQYH